MNKFLISLLLLLATIGCNSIIKCPEEADIDSSLPYIDSSIFIPGGLNMLKIQDKCGSQVSLTIDDNSIPENTTITITSLDEAPIRKLKKNTYSAFKITSNKELMGPVTITIESKDQVFNERTRIYYYKGDGIVEILPSQKAQNNSISAKTYHLSEFFVGDLSKKQFDKHVDKDRSAAGPEENDLLSDMRERVENDMALANEYQLHGWDELAEEIFSDIVDYMTDLVEKLKQEEGNCLDKAREYLTVQDIVRLLPDADALMDELSRLVDEALDSCPLYGYITYNVVMKAFCSGYPDYKYTSENIPFTITPEKVMCGGGNLLFDVDWTCQEEDVTLDMKIFMDMKATIEGELDEHDLKFDMPVQLLQDGNASVTMSSPEYPSGVVQFSMDIDSSNPGNFSFRMIITGLVNSSGTFEEEVNPGFFNVTIPAQDKGYYNIFVDEGVRLYLIVEMIDSEAELCDDNNVMTKDSLNVDCECVSKLISN